MIKKTVPLSSTASLTAEGVVLASARRRCWSCSAVAGIGTLTGTAPATSLLLRRSCHGVAANTWAAARRIPARLLGTLMYFTPTLQFLWGVRVVGEAMPPERWAGFAGVGRPRGVHRRSRPLGAGGAPRTAAGPPNCAEEHCAAGAATSRTNGLLAARTSRLRPRKEDSRRQR
jgi:hypothetical protein